MTFTMNSSVAFTLADQLESLVQRLGKAARDVQAGTVSLEIDTDRRTGLAQLGAELIHTFTLPEDQIHLMVPYLTHLAALRLFVEWKGFDAIPEKQGAAISREKLAAKLGGDQSLISIILALVKPYPRHSCCRTSAGMSLSLIPI